MLLKIYIFRILILKILLKIFPYLEFKNAFGDFFVRGLSTQAIKILFFPKHTPGYKLTGSQVVGNY